MRAAICRTPARQGEVAVADWDEFDAFLMPPRDSWMFLNSALKPLWEFDPWSEQYYHQRKLHPLRIDGFGQGYISVLTKGFQWKLCRTVMNLKHRVRREGISVVLCFRSYSAYAF